ncbi:hypothetical protein F0562_004176 [Nyssa sinensis]|uniref:HTH myb-type domain-containing protein n=1 Tax=Nyssa sinensis TaxID=561372 RepID=A0A5J5C1E5_9ASTE|nr:hypothetical protein F0562_004176 [Nyssa sinensis]
MRKPCSDKQDTNNGAGTKQQELQELLHYIPIHGEGCKRTLSKCFFFFLTYQHSRIIFSYCILSCGLGLHRSGKSCRLRWINYLRPDTLRRNFARDEEDLIIRLHALLGNRWSLIAGRLPGRTENEVKNYWNCHIRRKLISMGIDPNNHRLNQSPQNQCISPKWSMMDASTPSKTFGVGCLDVEDETSGSHDLNLTLTIAVPSPPSLPSPVEKKPQNNELKMAEEVESDQFPTLFLFR